MAKISNKPIDIPAGVNCTLENNQVVIQNSKGQLRVDLHPGLQIDIKDNQLVVNQLNEIKATKAFAGLVKSLIKNAFVGLTDGYSKTLKLVGTGYRVAAAGKNLNLAVGFSHPVIFEAPANVTLVVEGTDTIKIAGFDKQLVGQVAANIRKIRPPEPYKGKGIRYEDEVVRKKAGKTAAK